MSFLGWRLLWCCCQWESHSSGGSGWPVGQVCFQVRWYLGLIKVSSTIRLRPFPSASDAVDRWCLIILVGSSVGVNGNGTGSFGRAAETAGKRLGRQQSIILVIEYSIDYSGNSSNNPTLLKSIRNIFCFLEHTQNNIKLRNGFI